MFRAAGAHFFRKAGLNFESFARVATFSMLLRISLGAVGLRLVVSMFCFI